ncbi:MAG: DUF456 domain-containing protein [Acidimicrobiia bacterium]
MTLFVGLVIAVGVAGTLLPLIPGLGLVWLAAVVFGLIEGFGAVGWVAIALITGLAVSGTVAGVRVPQRAAAAGGIGWRGQLTALALAVVGFFVIPVAGAGIGFVGGIYLVARSKDPSRAWQITKTTLKSLFVAAGVQFVTALAMAGTWLVWAVIQ